MPRPRIAELVPLDKTLPLGAQAQRFVQFYIQCRDLKEAACKASLYPEMGTRLFREPRVRDAIQKRINIVDGEAARLAGRAKRLTVELLDASLYEEVKNKKNGQVRVRAIELGYKRTGLIRDGEFYVAPDAANKAPNIYQSSRTLRTTLMQEITETTAAVPELEDSVFRVIEY